MRDDIHGLIAKRGWGADEPLPSENELARRYGVAVGTARKALETLVNEGLLVRQRGRGTFVRRPDFTSSLFRFFRVRDSDGAPILPSGRVLSLAEDMAQGTVANKLSLASGDRVIRMERLRLMDGKPLLKETIWLPKEPFDALLDRAPNEFPDLLYPLYETLCGQVVARATEELAIGAATRDDAEALGLVEGAPVVLISRTTRGFDDRPLEWRTSRGPAETFRYHVEIR
jgi:GntR family transcriptional regulator